MLNEMGNTVRAHDGERRIEAPLHQGCDLVERPEGEHGAEPRVDALAELRPVRREIKARPFSSAQHRLRSGAQERGERTPRRVEHFERAQDALPVIGIEALRGRGIARPTVHREARAWRAPPPWLGQRPHRLRHGRDVRQALGQRAEIKPRAADKNNRLFADRPQESRAAASAHRPAEKLIAPSIAPNRRCGASRSSSSVGRAVRIRRSS